MAPRLLLVIGLLWVTTAWGSIVHYDGVKWTRVRERQQEDGERIHAIWGSGPADVWSVSAMHQATPCSVSSGRASSHDGWRNSMA